MVTSLFFVEVFFASKGLLGWPGTGALPAKFQLLWTRVVEPDLKLGNRGAIYLWVEEVDENNVPSGLPRAYGCLIRSSSPTDAQGARRDHGRPPAGRSGGGHVRQRLDGATQQGAKLQPDGGTSNGGKVEPPQGALERIPRVEFRPMPMPILPPKP